MKTPTTRRDFLKAAGTTAATLALGAATAEEKVAPAPESKNAFPRWRGFNLLHFFQALSRGERSEGRISEDDLRWIRDWGFDFIRIPMDYWLWIDSDWPKTRKLEPDDVFKIRESTLEKVDQTVEMGRKYGLHVSLNFHRAPGYCINQPEREPFVLWSDARAEEAFVHHWDVFAKRYHGVSTKELSFNLVNEAPSPRKGYMSREDYVRVMRRATRKIRETTPERIVIIDGLSVGSDVVDEMIPDGVAQSVHAYWPGGISHFRASWVDRNSSFSEPTWPLKDAKGTVKAGRADLEKRYEPWGKLARRGIGVHCGECGCYNRTPYEVFTAWFEDVMQILKSHSIGYALWEFRGSFGILDSGRR
ncbi:MAG: cellulase family glycosylhydrolase, partial [Planctomycetes bacterium]|nr:cellulase family glycosylhydrolase [Planctomycetota bacterium]